MAGMGKSLQQHATSTSDRKLHQQTNRGPGYRPEGRRRRAAREVSREKPPPVRVVRLATRGHEHPSCRTARRRRSAHKRGGNPAVVDGRATRCRSSRLSKNRGIASVWFLFDSVAAAWTGGKTREWDQAPIPIADLKQQVEIVVPSENEGWREVVEKDKQGCPITRRVHTLGDTVVRVRDRYYLSAVDPTGMDAACTSSRSCIPNIRRSRSRMP